MGPLRERASPSPAGGHKVPHSAQHRPVPTEQAPLIVTFTPVVPALATISRRVTHYEPTTISAARNLALRARGLTRTSSFAGVTGFGVSKRKRAL
jgi:hypothetical protein